MADHHGFIFISTNGHYLQRRKLMSHDAVDRIVWALTPFLDCAYLAPVAELGTIGAGQGWEELADLWDVAVHDIPKHFTPVPAKSVQRIEIGG